MSLLGVNIHMKSPQGSKDSADDAAEHGGGGEGAAEVATGIASGGAAGGAGGARVGSGRVASQEKVHVHLSNGEFAELDPPADEDEFLAFVRAAAEAIGE